MRRCNIAIITLAVVFACATAGFARTGGGHSYSGSHSSSHSSGSSSHSSGSSSHGSSSGSSSSRRSSSNSSSSTAVSSASSDNSNVACSVGCVVILLIALIVFFIALKWLQSRKPAVVKTSAADPFGQVRAIDANFSRSVFEDFCYALYEHAHHARAAGDLDRYAPYISEGSRRTLLARNVAGLKEVRGIVIGAMTVEAVTVGNVASVIVAYEANMTDVTDREQSWYVKERWTFDRALGVLSPPPAKAKAEHCPKCGAPLQTRSDGACQYCGTKITSGAFQWFVTAIELLEKDERGPLLTSNVPEEGTNLKTVRQADLATRTAEFQETHPSFQWPPFLSRAREIAVQLQTAWSSRDWERVRPLETEQLFQTHRYWIDAYIRQNLRNVVDDYRVTNIEPVKIDTDAFYDAITVRMWASGRDSTVDASGKVVAGSRDKVRQWSEYWTFIRTRGTEADPNTTVSCPNCGASVKVGSTGICSSCGGKLTSGEFGWVLSRIEQDEDYTG